MKVSIVSSRRTGRYLVLATAILTFMMKPGAVLAQPTLVDVATATRSPEGQTYAEPSIAVDPSDPSRIAIVASGCLDSGAGCWGKDTMVPVWKSNDGCLTWRRVLQ